MHHDGNAQKEDGSMLNQNLKSMKLFLVLFCLSLTSILILSCSSDSGDGDDNPQTYFASGTYDYNSGTGVLTATFTDSDFPGCGPVVGDETHDVDSISETTMVWNDGEEDMLVWDRDSGIADDITGTWDRIDDDGNVYELTLDADGSISVIADIVECSDSGQCNITATVRLWNLTNVTGAIVTAGGMNCTTSKGICTIYNVIPCGETFTTTASYTGQPDVSADVRTSSGGGTSAVTLTFPSPAQ